MFGYTHSMIAYGNALKTKYRLTNQEVKESERLIVNQVEGGKLLFKNEMRKKLSIIKKTNNDDF